MYDLLLWLYLCNAVLIINHEIDSAYWNEWKLFKIPGGITTFLSLHFPLLFLILIGLILIKDQSFIGLLISILLGAGGFFAFAIHTYFLRQGRDEFNQPLSKIILWMTLVLSLLQLCVTLYLIIS